MVCGSDCEPSLPLPFPSVGVEGEPVAVMEGALVTDAGERSRRQDLSSERPTVMNSVVPPCRPLASCM